MIVVTVYYNTDADGRPVPENVSLEDGPQCIFGPFDSMEEAVEWMNYGYPDGDTEVEEILAHERDDVWGEGVYVNSPSLHPINREEEE